MKKPLKIILGTIAVIAAPGTVFIVAGYLLYKYRDKYKNLTKFFRIKNKKNNYDKKS